MSNMLCFMDFEYTTSGDKKIDFRQDKIELLSIGAVFVDKITNIEIGRFYEVVRPKKNTVLSEYCKDLTKISQDEVDNARSMQEVVDAFVEVSKRYSNTKYCIWGNFDYIALKKSVRINSYEGSFKSIINQARNIQPMISKSIRYKREILNTEWGLQKIKQVYGMMESENKHNALSDAYDLWAVYTSYKEKQEKNIGMLKAIYEENERKRKEILERRLVGHDDDIKGLWLKMDKYRKTKPQEINKSEFKKLIGQLDVEYRHIQSISYHGKTISIVKDGPDSENIIGCRISGHPLPHSKQYKFEELKVDVVPRIKKNKENGNEIPAIEIRVYNRSKKVFSVIVDVEKRTKKRIVKFIKRTFLECRKEPLN